VGEAPSAMLFGLVVFGLSSIAAFSVLAILQTAGLGDQLHDLRGLAHRSPAAAVPLAFAMATLAGAPPLGGFLARLFIVISAFDSNYGWLAVVALAAAVITAVPLLRAVASMWAETGDEQPFTTYATPRLGRMVSAFCCLGAFYITVLAQPILLLARGGAGPVH
jgi:NADH-quinone oxidoreductase subunit N